jgi:hypothetical protein
MWEMASPETKDEVAEIAPRLERAGFRLLHMASLLYAWDKDMGDGSSIQVHTDRHMPSGDADRGVWRVGRYSDAGGVVETLQAYRLDEAIAAAHSLPYPSREGEPVRIEMDTIDDLVAFLQGPAPADTVVKASFGQQTPSTREDDHEDIRSAHGA